MFSATRTRVRAYRRGAAEFNGESVAAGFAFAADLMADPPDGRIEEQQRFGEELEQVGEIIAAADVGEFMQQHELDLRRRQRGEQRERQDERRDDARRPRRER